MDCHGITIDEGNVNSCVPNHFSGDDHVDLLHLKRDLEETSRSIRSRRRVAQDTKQSESIFRCPSYLKEINRAYMPELVSIGPYHRGRDKLLDFEQYKWYYFDAHNYGTTRHGNEMSIYIDRINDCVSCAKSCYSEILFMSDYDFIKMMILDGCFVVEFLKRLGSPTHEGGLEIEGDPILTRPWLIPIVIGDLLKLENQIPFFVLESLLNQEEEKQSIKIAALTVFNLLFQMPWDTRLKNKASVYDPKNLLDLFHHCLSPLERTQVNPFVEFKRCPYTLTHSIQPAKQLRSSGIKMKPKKVDSFLDIKFQNKVLEIPFITINEWTTTVLFNCVALEQSRKDVITFFTSYVVFMKSLIHDTEDVSYLCSDGIITSFSKNDQFVAKFFNDVERMVSFNVRNSYLYEQIKEVNTYCSSHWATMTRTYFSSPWASISVFYALLLLFLNLTQTQFTVASYYYQRNQNKVYDLKN